MTNISPDALESLRWVEAGDLLRLRFTAAGFPGFQQFMASVGVGSLIGQIPETSELFAIEDHKAWRTDVDRSMELAVSLGFNPARLIKEGTEHLESLEVERRSRRHINALRTRRGDFRFKFRDEPESLAALELLLSLPEGALRITEGFDKLVEAYCSGGWGAQDQREGIFRSHLSHPFCAPYLTEMIYHIVPSLEFLLWNS